MTIHIHRPAGHYIGQVRKRYERRWRTVTAKLQTPEKALSMAALMMAPSDAFACVLFLTDWYDPMVAMEVTR